MNNNRILYLSKKMVTILFVYYFLVFLTGTVSAMLTLIPSLIFKTKPYVGDLAILGSIGMALNGSSIFYIRKLYKSCFSENLCIVSCSDNFHQRLGTCMYFVARPLFAIGFSLLILIGLQSGFMLTSSKPIELDNGFIYLSMFFSFFAGFLSGRFVKTLERKGERVLNKLLDENSN